MNRIRILTKQNLRNWLRSKTPGTLVGKVGDCDACPIYNFLEENNVDVYYVNNRVIHIIGIDGDILVPHWVSKFIDEIDKSNHQNVTARRALRILDEIEGLR